MNQKRKRSIFRNILSTLGTSLLGNMLADKSILTAGYGNKGDGIVRAGYGSKMDFQCRLILWLSWNTKVLSKEIQI